MSRTPATILTALLLASCGAGGGGTSSDPTKPVALTVGAAVSGTLTSNSDVHYFSFTPATSGRFTVTLSQAASGIQTNWCPDSTATGCACVANNNYTTCCTVDARSPVTCSYAMEKSAGVALDAGTTIHPQVYPIGVDATGGAYTLTITAL